MGEGGVIIYSEYVKFQVIFPCGETGRARRALRLNTEGTEGPASRAHGGRGGGAGCRQARCAFLAPSQGLLRGRKCPAGHPLSRSRPRDVASSPGGPGEDPRLPLRFVPAPPPGRWRPYVFEGILLFPVRLFFPPPLPAFCSCAASWPMEALCLRRRQGK